MILLCNVLISENRSPTTKGVFDRKHLKHSSRFDVFKYSLCSLSVIPWNKVIFCISLDKEYEERRDELKDFISEEFLEYGYNPIIFWKRREYQREWQELIEKYVFTEEKQAVYFLCNDDHIFMENELWTIKRIDYVFRNDPYPYKSCYTSHWPELLRWAVINKGETNGDFIKFPLRDNGDSVQFVSFEVLAHWWFSRNYGNIYIPRSDYFDGVHVDPIPMVCYVPLREQFAHFDGYTHVGVSNKDRPPLEIPEGFFSENMELNFYYESRQNGVWINPQKPYKAFIGNRGTDYKFAYSRIPLFWHGRIGKITQNNSSEGMDKASKEAYYQAANARMKLDGINLPRELIKYD